MSRRIAQHVLFLLLLTGLRFDVAAQPQNPADPQSVKKQLYAAVSAGDSQRFASLVDSIDQKERDEFLLYVLSQSKAQPLEMVRTLVEKGADVNQPSRYKTALMHAANQGYAEIVRFLLAKGARVNNNTDEGTALLEAVSGGHAEVMRLLLAAGADARAVYRTGDHALIMAARQRSYRSPAAEPNAEIVQLLLDHGADPNARGAWGHTALMEANTAAKVKLLLTKGAELETQDEEGRTALLHAAGRGDVAVAAALLDHGANVNAADKRGSSALLSALDRENMVHGAEAKTLPERRLEVARRILAVKNVDVNAPNTDGESSLLRAVRLENVEMIKALLERGADPNRSDVFGVTPIVEAYANGNVEIEKLLPVTSFKGNSAEVLNAFLRAAIGKKDETKVRELLALGADANHEYAIGYRHKSVKSTVLISAAMMGHAGIVQLLLDKGANVNAEGLISGSESGLRSGTALEAAEFSNHPEIAALLRRVRQD